MYKYIEMSKLWINIQLLNCASLSSLYALELAGIKSTSVSDKSIINPSGPGGIKLIHFTRWLIYEATRNLKQH